MFPESISKICCITNIEFSVQLTFQNIYIIHILDKAGALNYAEFRATLTLLVIPLVVFTSGVLRIAIGFLFRCSFPAIH